MGRRAKTMIGLGTAKKLRGALSTVFAALIVVAVATGVSATAQSQQQGTPPGQAPGQAPGPIPATLPTRQPGQGPATQVPSVPSVPSNAPTANGAADNPFPGESNDVPILPVGGGAAGAADGGDSGSPAASGVPDVAAAPVDPDGDPVQTPDPGGFGAGSSDGFSSSRSGVSNAVSPDVRDANGQTERVKTRDQVVKEDLDVGGYYLDQHDWPGALGRFQAAFTLDSENQNALYGMAQAEWHMEKWQDARQHFELYLTYDPDGRKSRDARKALEVIDKAHPVSAR